MVKTYRLERKTVCLALAELEVPSLISRENGPDVPHDATSSLPQAGVLNGLTQKATRVAKRVTRWGAKRVRRWGAKRVTKDIQLRKSKREIHWALQGLRRFPMNLYEPKNVPRNIKMIRQEMEEVVKFTKDLGWPPCGPYTHTKLDIGGRRTKNPNPPCSLA
jgi:hypothetical protein